MRKIDALRFLSGVGSADVEKLVSEFDAPAGSIRSRMTIMNHQGLVKKDRDGRRLVYTLTEAGKRKLEWLEDREEDEDILEENKASGGNKKMPRKRYIEDGLYVCPSCENEFELEGVLEGSSESLCPDCGDELEMMDDDEDTGNDNEEFEPVKRRR